MRWPRLHFGDGGTLDLSEPVDAWHRDDFERKWAEDHVRVEWMLSRRGRLDRALTYEMPNPPDRVSPER